MLVTIFVFNPFISGITMEYKQYVLDLFFSLLFLDYFLTESSRVKQGVFFAFWIFFSNVGLFFAAGFMLKEFLDFCGSKSEKSFLQVFGVFFRSIIPIFLSLIPYICYYVWFLNQDGAPELKAYMLVYWESAFIPLDSRLPMWILLQIHALYIYFFSSYEIVGLLMLLIAGFGFIGFVREYHGGQKTILNQAILLYLLVMGIHLSLSLMKMYPFSDRLYVYLAPLFCLLFGKGLQVVFRILFKGDDSRAMERISLVLLSAILAGFYLTYSFMYPGSMNEMMAEVKKDGDLKVFATSKAAWEVNDWDTFYTESFPGMDENPEVEVFRDEDLQSFPKKGYLISSQHLKFGHKGKRSNPESMVMTLDSLGYLQEMRSFGSYILYELK
ncbi:hypothetical protein [Algoriphagus sp.]|uniref:hypothetical protein n=1 Tax=Algoriphagus sp. TaxID=1872435 RepID=UPI003F70E600